MSTALVFPIYDSSTTTKETNTFIESAVKGQGKSEDQAPESDQVKMHWKVQGGSSPKSPRQMSPRKNAKTTPSNKPKGCHSPLKTPPNTQRSKSVSGVKKSPLENQKTDQKSSHMESSCCQPVQSSKSGKNMRKTRQRKAWINRKKLSRVSLSNVGEVIKRKLSEVNKESKIAKQIANGYFCKWKITIWKRTRNFFVLRMLFFKSIYQEVCYLKNTC
ncbi:hypothetical protein P5673_021652 [Acropora cervicornis]|uniref:Uncharacterized protein n=1 Tax=Acropora cervicornis TaxID=6130 RepID=A0AAD9V0M1_ACRCE|nr:hypothetical protein P5673_021652 [Acropora cervicornis]